MQGFHDLRDLKSELALIPSQEPESVLAWAKEHPASAWAQHLAQHGERVMTEYVRRLIQVVIVIDTPIPKRAEIPVKVAPLPPPRPSRLHQNVKPVPQSVRRTQLVEFFKTFAPLRLAYADVPELKSLFAEAERLRKEFSIF
jgi:hypothetical protein